MAAQFGGRVTFVSENFGGSKLAEKYGVKGYPAVFVDDVLVAAPREFGYFGEVQGAGRYAPWRNADSQARFKADLTRMVELVLAGRKDLASGAAAGPGPIAALPKLRLTDLSGNSISTADLNGRVVLVEFWATWCPPCRSTLGWLGELKKQHGDRIAVVAIAVESPEDKIREAVASHSGDIRWTVANAAVAGAFGDITSVPTMFVFDREGRTARVIYGAPPDLHDQAGALIDRLLK